MAKIKYSALVSDMRNKLNGSVMSKNRYGSYIRNKVTPVNPQTSFQLNQRANLSALSAAWRGLTQIQRDGWAALAAASPRTDIFGDAKILAANAAFVSFNLNLLAAGQSQISDAPVLSDVPLIQPVNVVAEVTAGVNSALTFDASPSAIPAGFSLIVYATESVSPGISFVKNKYRYLGVFIPLDGSVDLLEAYTARFGNMVLGNKVFLRTAYVSNTSGQLGLPAAAEVVVEAGA